MPLYALSKGSIEAVGRTTFSAAGMQERADLQRILRENIEIVSPDTLVVAEEFGSWDASYRRIDLLGVDRDANLVVIELKRDDTGTHMELQALRYAAMVARMTFEQAVEAYHRHLSHSSQSSAREEDSWDWAPRPEDSQYTASREDARGRLLEFLGWDEPNESAFAQDVRIVLVAADFSREITTSVMWLNERDLDIRCVQLQPYRHGDQMLVQVEQLIPLREASEYQVQVREKARSERASTSSGPDYTRYDLSVGNQNFERLYKRRLIYHAVRYVIEHLHKTPEDITQVVRHSRMWASVDGEHDEEGFREALADLEARGGAHIEPRRFLSSDDELLHVGGRTYAFTSQWGTNTIPAVEALRAAFPEANIRYQASADN